MPATVHHFTRSWTPRAIGRRHERIAIEGAAVGPDGRPVVERIAVCEGNGAARNAALIAAAEQLLEAAETAYAMCEAQGAQDTEVARKLRRAIQAARRGLV